jgi:hypothetical protein
MIGAIVMCMPLVFTSLNGARDASCTVGGDTYALTLPKPPSHQLSLSGRALVTVMCQLVAPGDQGPAHWYANCETLNGEPL